MAAITSTIMAAGGLALSAAQMVKANKDQKAAQSAANLAAATIKSTKQQNAFKAMQAPDVASLAQQSNLQSQAQSVQALQEMGPEGAAMIAGIDMNARQGNLEAASQQGQVNFQRDQMQAQAQQNVNRDKYLTDTNMEMQRLQGAQQEDVNAQANKNAAITGMFTGLGGIASGLGEAMPLYMEKKNGNDGINVTEGTRTVNGSPNSWNDSLFESTNPFDPRLGSIG